MMKYLFLILLLFSGVARSQNLMLRGSVNQSDGKPVPSATVLLYKHADTLLFKATVTDKSGKFMVTGLLSQKYDVVVSCLGYDTYRLTDLELPANPELTPIILKAAAQQLATVNVSARKQLIQVMPDKTVFNVQGSLNSTGLSAFDLLRKAPGVIIDNQNSLIVEGKTGVQIYIDGKASQLSGDDLVNYLKSMQSSDLEAIEIITQPSSKYDAAGTAGILNLRLKKNSNLGTNGSVMMGYAIGTYSKYNASLSLNHRSDKLNIFSTYSTNIGKNYSYINLDRFQSGDEYNQRSSNLSSGQDHNLRAGMDYFLNKANTIGVLVSGNFNSNQSTNSSRTPITELSTGTFQQVLDAYNYTNSHNNNFAANLNYRYAGKSGREFTTDVDYGYYYSGRNSLQPNFYYNSTETAITSENSFRQITPIAIHLFSLKADYAQSLGKGKIAAGLKTSEVKTGNVFSFYDVGQTEVYNSSRSNNFDYTENINAAYVNFSQTWKGVSVQAGLRAEQTISDGLLTSTQQNQDNNVKRNYLDFFPSGGLTYQLNDKNSLALNYSSRIERPDYRSLNPFEYNIDELSFSKGNPFLKPQYTNSIKLSNTYNYTLNTSVTYSYIRNFFAQITDTLGTNQNYISPQNIANEKVINFSVSYPLSVYKWWSAYASLSAYRSTYESTNVKFIPGNQNTLSFYGQNSFSLPGKYSLEISGWFSSPSIWAGTYRTRSLGSLDAAMQKSWLDNALSLRIAVSDILKTSNWTGTTQYGALFIKGSGGYESRQLRVSLNYNFGRKTVKAADSRKSGADEEKGRISN